MRDAGAHVLLCVAVLFAARGAAAEESGKAAREKDHGRKGAAHTGTAAARDQAKIHFKAGTAFLQLGEYDRAIAEYLEAYGLLPLPDFLFNLGQAYRLKGTPGDRQHAAKYYRQYLKEKPDGVGVAEARQHLATIKKEPGLIITDSTPPVKVPEPEKTPAPPPAAAAPPLPRPPPVSAPAAATTAVSPLPLKPRSIASRPAFWGILAGGVALVGAGVATGVVVGGGPRDPVPSVEVIHFGLGPF